jgi:uroporphyrinogen decarboxylase
MGKRDVVETVLSGGRPPYVPWNFGFTAEAREKLAAHFGVDQLQARLDNHLLELGSAVGFFEPVGNRCYRDVFGVVWDRSVDRDIGIPKGQVLPEPSLAGLALPDPLDSRFFDDIPARIAAAPDRYRVFCIGFSLFERAWTLRGMEQLLLDFVEHPDFVHELLSALADYNIIQARAAMEYDIDAVYFGDDWGQQHGLIMGRPRWREFIYPQLRRMYDAVHAGGKRVMIHSCGDVAELFDDLIELGLDCFNPFQPEVTDVPAMLQRYRGRLAFYGGLSTQRTLPYGTVDDVRRESRQLLALGRDGGYIFAPAHAVEGDVPLENMLAFIEEAQSQPGCA